MEKLIGRHLTQVPSDDSVRMAFRYGRLGFDEWAELFCTETRDVPKSNPGRGVQNGC